MVNAQKIGQDGGRIRIDPTGAPHRVVGVPSNSGTDTSATQDTSKRMMVWMETGHGNFTTNPLTCYQFLPSTSTAPHSPFLFATNLYDTTKGLVKPSRLISNTSSVPAYISSDFFPKMLGSSKIRITPNTLDLVPGDTMAFAVTYNTYKQPSDGPINNKTNSVFKIYFFYNIDSTFIPVTSNNQSNLMIGASPKNCREHNGEAISFNPTLPPTGINAYGFHDWISYTITAPDNEERSVFFTMLPINDSLKIGTSGSVYAVLTENDNVIGTHFIQSMPFKPAHDPNYLIQKPAPCIQFPKKGYPFEYTVHFQNTGAGKATEVKVVVHLPKGMDWNSLGIKKATFAGTDYTNKITVNTDRSNNELTIIFKYDFVNHANYLLGTHDSKQPAIDPQTMGEILFTINSTPNTEDNLISYADIYFRSEHPSADTTEEGYESPVRTNNGVTNYKDCCNGNCTPVPPCCKILGLNLWWWLIILIILNIIIWYIILKRRRNKKC